MFDVEVHPKYAKNGWIYLAYWAEIDYRRLRRRPRQPRPGAAGREVSQGQAVERRQVARSRSGAAPPPDPNTSMTGDRARRRSTNERVGRAAGALPRAAGALQLEQRALRLAVHLRSRQGHLFFTLGETRRDARTRRTCRTRLGKIHRVNDDGSMPKDNPVREPVRRAADDLELRAPQSARARVGSGDRQAVGERARPDRAATRSTSSKPGTTTAGASITMGIQHWHHEARARQAWSSRSCCYTPTIAPSGIVFYTGDALSRLEEQPVRERAREASSCGDWRSRGDKVDASGSRSSTSSAACTTSIIGPDGYLYVTLQLPGQLAVGIDCGHGGSAGPRSSSRWSEAAMEGSSPLKRCGRDQRCDKDTRSRGPTQSCSRAAVARTPGGHGGQ